MPTLREAHEWIKNELRKGKGDLHMPRLKIVEEEVAKRIANPPDEQGERKTKIAWDTDDPDVYSEFHKERERYMQCAGSNKTLATEAMIVALKIQPSSMVREFIEAIQQQKANHDRLSVDQEKHS